MLPPKYIKYFVFLFSFPYKSADLYICDFIDGMPQYLVALFVALLQNLGYRIFSELTILYLHQGVMHDRVKRFAALAVCLDTQLSESLGKLLYDHLHSV